MVAVDCRELIARYLAGEMEGVQLEDALETLTWDTTDPEITRFAGEALRLLAEHSNGDWTDGELRTKLGVISRTYWFDHAPRRSWGSSAADTSEHGEAAPSGFLGAARHPLVQRA